QIAETAPLGIQLPSSKAAPAPLDRLARIERAAATVWAAGVAVSFGLLLVGIARLASIAARSRRLVAPSWTRAADELGRTYELRRAIRLGVSDSHMLLVTWGVLYPRVIVPAAAVNWSDE